MAAVSLCALAALAGACGDDGGSSEADASVDAGDADAGSVFAIAAPAPVAAGPLPPAPPRFEDCPAGWRAVLGDDEIATCDPWPEGGRVTCPDGEAHFPGEAGCEPVGRPCPSGEFPDLSGVAEALYVRAGATGGDGTMEAPFGTIAEATAAASDGSVIALGAGTWDEEVYLRRGVTLRGACASATTIVSSRPLGAGDPGGAVVRITGSGARIEDLRIGPSRRPAIWAMGRGIAVDVDGVIVDSAELSALMVGEGGRVTAHDVVVRNTQPYQPTRQLGRGFDVKTDGTVEIRRAVVEGNRETGIFAYDGSTVSVEDTAILDTSSQEVDAPSASASPSWMELS